MVNVLVYVVNKLCCRNKGNTEAQENISTWKVKPGQGFKEWVRVCQMDTVLKDISGGGKFSPVQLLSRIWLFAIPWTEAHQASLSITNSRSLLKLMCIESVMPSSHLILCRPLLILPPISPSIKVFSNESTLHIRGPKYWSFSLSISPSNEVAKRQCNVAKRLQVSESNGTASTSYSLGDFRGVS